MAHVRLRLSGQPSGKEHPHVTLTAGQRSVTIFVTKARVQHSGRAPRWVEIERPQQLSLLRNAGPQRRRFQLETILKNIKQPGGPVEADIEAIEAMANGDDPVRVAYGPLEAGIWRIETFEPVTQKRAHGSNQVTIAEATIGLISAEDDSTKVPSARRPPPKTPASTPAAATPRGQTAKTKVHIVRKGDTLSRIALEHCGNANLWPKLAKANGLRNPHRILPGQKIKIVC